MRRTRHRQTVTFGNLPVRVYVVSFLLSFVAQVGLAQDRSPADPTTLRVFITQLQVAALVMDGDRKPVPNLDPTRFRLSFDGQKPFPPTLVRREGDDPISLAVVLDLSAPHAYQDHLVDALAALRESSLLPHDRLLLFAADCRFLSMPGNLATLDAVRKAANLLISNPDLHRSGEKIGSCANHLQLWDGALVALQQLSTQPGRHILLLVSNGADTASIATLDHLAHYASFTATTVFTLVSNNGVQQSARANSPELLASSSGGWVLDPPGKDVAQSFASFIALLRNRYVLEFPRPSTLKPGNHQLAVSVAHSVYTVRNSGFWTPVSDPTTIKDPNTIRYDGVDGGALNPPASDSTSAPSPGQPVPASPPQPNPGNPPGGQPSMPPSPERPPQ